MANPKYTITHATSVGIYDHCEYTARIYQDKITVTSPYIRWDGNSGGYAEKKQTIANAIITKNVIADLANHDTSSAWNRIGNAIDDDYLMNA